MQGVLLALAFVSAWFPLTTVPSVASVDWRCGTRGEQLRVRLTPPVATTTVVFRARRVRLDGGGWTTPWLTRTAEVELIQGTSARTLVATVTVRFALAGYCRPYLPPPFTLNVVRR
jgi:hypothetical protein